METIDRTALLNGLENNEFKMYLQFIVDNRSKKIVSAEALSRWDSPNGIVGPVKYISMLETEGLISAHDFHMFEMVCRQLEAWANSEFCDLSISCNFTRITLSEEDFVERLEAIANAYRFDKSKLSIEITEDAMEKNLAVATENVRRCKEMGFVIALDDLGGGYTSLINLCDYPIDVVKLDRGILLKCDTARGKALFSGIIALAHSLDIRVVCEGVETEEQKKLVHETNCDYLQGWYFSTPIPQEKWAPFIKTFA